VVANPAYPGRATTIADATARLSAFCQSADHSFWTDHVSLRDRERFKPNYIRGHIQLTDTYLLGLVVAHQGRLITFDSAIVLEAISGTTAEQKLVLAP